MDTKRVVYFFCYDILLRCYVLFVNTRLALYENVFVFFKFVSPEGF